MWVVVRCLLGDEIADLADEVEAFGPYVTKEEARARRVQLCEVNLETGELDPLDFEANCYVLKLK